MIDYTEHKLKIENILKNETRSGFDILEGLVLLVYRGSIAHGTYIPNSDPNSIDDIDIIGIAIPPSEYFFGLSHFEQIEIKKDCYDIVIYDIRKAFRLLLKANPNMLSILWTEPELYIIKTELGNRLIRNRDMFSSTMVYHSFLGYADSQLKKMTAYSTNGYMGQKRKQLVEKYSYDCKNASHLIRLLQQCLEFMKDGKLRVKRPDFQELIDIKTGKWTLEHVKSEANKLIDRIKFEKQFCGLPEKALFEQVNMFLDGMLWDWFKTGIYKNGITR